MRSLKTAVVLTALAVSLANGAEVLLSSKRVEKAALDPLDQAWKKAAPATILLIPQSFTAPHGGGSVKSVEARSLFTEAELYVRLSWSDASRNAKLDNGGKFSDACALQFPVKEGSIPSPFMGEEGQPVNVWHWRAANIEDDRYEKAYSDYYRPGSIDQHVAFPAGAARSLFAEGFGTLTQGAIQDVQAAGVWKDGRWTVVFKRALVSRDGAAFKKENVVPVAFAVWDGEDQDRNGSKSLSLWHALALGEGKLPEPKAPEERGRRVFSRYGCVTCHGPGGRGGVKNSNAQGGEVPAIDKVREGFTEEELEQVIRLGRRSVSEDPNGPVPPLRMINWGQAMSEEELHDLVTYLMTLAPKGEEW